MIDTQEFEPIAPDQGPQVRRSLKANPGPADRFFRGAVRGGGVAVLAIMLLVGSFLAYRGWQALHKAGLSFFTTQERPSERLFAAMRRQPTRSSPSSFGVCHADPLSASEM